MKKGLLGKIIDTNLGVLLIVIVPAFISYKVIDIDKINSYMDSITTNELFRILISFSVGIIIYISLKLRKLKTEILEYIDNSKEEAIEFDMMLDTIQTRKINYLIEYIDAMENGKERPASNETNWLTPLEQAFYEKSITNRDKIIKKIK